MDTYTSDYMFKPLIAFQEIGPKMLKNDTVITTQTTILLYHTYFNI